MITKYFNNLAKGVFTLLLLSTTSLFMTSCSDFFDQESDNVIYSEKDHLTNWPDTVYSVMGILNKMQVIADRTILLGEVRGDLVTLTSAASSDLRDLASFNVGDDNMYNVPRDYYAIINNCNYFIANVDTAMKNNRNQSVFMNEYAAVKAFRAWTYLQLVLNYGSVPFITEPILTKEESERNYPRYDLAAICQYFLDDLSTLPEACETEYPNYGSNVRGNDSRFFFFPLNILRGELNLWLGSTKGKSGGKANFEQAVLWYYKYLNNRNGTNTAFATGTNFVMWDYAKNNWLQPMNSGTYSNFFLDEIYDKDSEWITIIPGDSIRAEGYYSELRNLFYSREENDYKVSIKPSDRMVEISEAQVNCRLASNGIDSVYAPAGLSSHYSGDLRLAAVWTESYNNDKVTGEKIETQYLYKYVTRNVHIYRRQMLYLHLAEALNLAGYPRAAFKILSRGLTENVLKKEVYPYLSEEDQSWLSDNLPFPSGTSLYQVLEAEDIVTKNTAARNTMGIHSRGSGWTPKNIHYRLVGDTITCWNATEVDSVTTVWEFDKDQYDVLIPQQQAQVDSLILEESALELCFEGTRFYDLMRYAMRSDNPGEFMTRHIYARRGKNSTGEVQAEIKNNLTNPQNWYLKWNGKIGF